MISETQATQSLEPIEQYRPLLEVFEAIYFRASRPQALFKELAKRLPSVVQLEFIGLILHDPNRDVMRLHILEIDQTERIPEGLELPMEESASAWVMRTQQRLEMPCVLKLLRVLQEQEFERLGSTRTIRVNVRIVAATNWDLARLVEEQKFRSDLYYRLKVFPITAPPLRDRPEDIPYWSDTLLKNSPNE